MIDQAYVNTPTPILLDPNLIARGGDFAIADGFGIYNLHLDAPKDLRDPLQARCHRARIEVLPSNAFTIYSKKGAGGYYAVGYSLNFPKILWRHNGRVVSTDFQIAGVLGFVWRAFRQIVAVPEQADLLIPGINQEKGAFWSSMEVGLNLRDPDEVILDAMRSMRSPRIRAKTAIWPGETITLAGSDLKLNVYRKDIQMRKKGHRLRLKQEPVVRLEVKVKFSNPSWFDGLALEDRPLMVERGDKRRVVGFHLDNLRAIFKHFFGPLRGVFRITPGPGAKSITKLAATLGNISLVHQIPAGQLADIHSATNKVPAATMSDLRSGISTFLEQHSTLDRGELLSCEAFEYPASVDVIHERGEPVQGYLHLLKIEKFDWPDALWKAYGGRKPRPFTPLLSLSLP